jgi:uncharacterized protein
MPVVSNTSPILNLAIINQLDLLRQQFEEVIIPAAVLSELRLDEEFPGVNPIRQALQSAWMHTTEVKNSHVVRALRLELDHGESEAIALSLELGLNQILMDENDGRTIAKAMGLTPTGVLGILLKAKRAGKLDSIKLVMRILQQDAGFYIAPDLLTALLREAGE